MRVWRAPLSPGHYTHTHTSIGSAVFPPSSLSKELGVDPDWEAGSWEQQQQGSLTSSYGEWPCDVSLWGELVKPKIKTAKKNKQKKNKQSKINRTTTCWLEQEELKVHRRWLMFGGKVTFGQGGFLQQADYGLTALYKRCSNKWLHCGTTSDAVRVSDLDIKTESSMSPQWPSKVLISMKTNCRMNNDSVIYGKCILIERGII